MVDPTTCTALPCREIDIFGAVHTALHAAAAAKGGCEK